MKVRLHRKWRDGNRGKHKMVFRLALAGIEHVTKCYFVRLNLYNAVTSWRFLPAPN